MKFNEGGLFANGGMKWHKISNSHSIPGITSTNSIENHQGIHCLSKCAINNYSSKLTLAL